MIVAIAIFFIFPIWACSLAALISIIALTFMLNDFLNDRAAKRSVLAAESEKTIFAEPLDESYPEWKGRELHFPKMSPDEPLPRKNAIELYSQLFQIDDGRAKNLYSAGYYNLHMLSNSDISDLIKIQGINPTLARRIKNSAKVAING